MRFALLSVVAVFASSTAFAMQCGDVNDERVVSESELAFTGTVLSTTGSAYKPRPSCWEASVEQPNCGGRLATVKVGEWLRGSGGETVTILKEDGCYCLGGYWTAGDQMLFIARRNMLPSRLPGELIADNVCAGTGAMDERRAALVSKFKSQPIRAQIK